jgi:hypothetical protein
MLFHTNTGAFISSTLIFKAVLPPGLSGPWKCQWLLSSLCACKGFCATEKGSPLPSKLHFIQLALFTLLQLVNIAKLDSEENLKRYHNA